MSCNHTIGILHGKFVSVDDVNNRLKEEANSWTQHSKMISALTGGEKKTYKATDFVDGRRGYMSMFEFCPYCGEKINWRKIKKLLTKEDL